MALKLVKKGEDKLAIEGARDQLIESAGKISANMLGMVSRVGGQIYALLFLTREPMSLDEIAEDLKISKGNVSVNIRMLEDKGLAKEVWVKGDRKNYYQVSRDYPTKLLKGFFDQVRGGIDNSLRVINSSLGDFKKIEKKVSSDSQEDIQFILSQLTLILSFYRAASQLFEDFYQGREVNVNLLRQVILE